MSWRVVVVTKSAKLEYSMEYLVVRDAESTTKVHLGDISVLLIENTACAITTALMSQLLQHKIKVIFCDEKRNPCGELTAYYGCHDCSQKLKDQLSWTRDAKQLIWTAIVGEKIKNQMLVLRAVQSPRADQLCRYLDELEFGDRTNREGHAAKVYFNALFGSHFSRSDDCPTNAALNYGYSLILSCFNREVVAAGYLTQLGLFHDNMFNTYNLSCDLMEPFRPLVDACVHKLGPKQFEKAENGPDFDEFKIDTSFHSYLIDITENSILINMYHSVMVQQMRLAMYAALKDDRNRVGNLEQHRAIIDALLRENGEDVQDAIILHINHSLIKSLKMIKNED